jgi:hypothetical protein
MDSIRIKNLRSLVDTGDIEIKPLNIILGSNSSGKSSFLRFFPLLKQTINRKIRGVLFWSGYDQNDVDFGDFETALNNQEGHDKMEFSFSFNITKRELSRFSRPYKFEIQNYWSKTPQSLKTTISICLEKNNADGLETISRVTIPIFGEDITINVSNKKINIGDRKYRLLTSDNGYLYRLDSIFHLNNLLDSEEIIKKELGTIIEEINSDNLPIILEYHDIIKKDLIKLSKVNQDNEEYEILKVKELTKNELIIYKDMLLINFLETILKISDNYITSYFNKSVYIAPIRATAERYYRLRNLSIEEVDSSGRNLVDFLYNLDNRKFQQFQEWTNEFLGFQVEKDGIGNDEINKGYVSIYIRKNGDQNRYNLSDTGFGYSQILPIVTQLWFIAYNARKKWYFLKSPTTIIIEQPELHLHPKLQSKLISAICSLANDQFRFIIETHSETIINKIGDLIYKKKIGNEDVNIQIFSKKNEKMETIVESSSYDEEGFLENWPIGFFDEGNYL